MQHGPQIALETKSMGLSRRTQRGMILREHGQLVAGEANNLVGRATQSGICIPVLPHVFGHGACGRRVLNWKSQWASSPKMGMHCWTRAPPFSTVSFSNKGRERTNLHRINKQFPIKYAHRCDLLAKKPCSELGFVLEVFFDLNLWGPALAKN
jgi:hypothetical protein